MPCFFCVCVDFYSSLGAAEMYFHFSWMLFTGCLPASAPRVLSIRLKCSYGNCLSLCVYSSMDLSGSPPPQPSPTWPLRLKIAPAVLWCVLSSLSRFFIHSTDDECVIVFLLTVSPSYFGSPFNCSI